MSQTATVPQHPARTASGRTPEPSALLAEARALAGDLTELRHALHREPELGLDLPRTQRKVLDALGGLGFELATGTETTSVTAVLRGTGAGPRRTVLLRADMDALPVQEETGLDYASRIDGAMHACGHDLHTAMLLGAARLLAGRRADLSGDVVLMFQPGEEGHDGAGVMIREGVLGAAGRRPDAAFAMHVVTGMLPGGMTASRPGPVMSASDNLEVTLHGTGGHGSAPHAALDPVPAAAETVTALQNMVTRRFDVFDPVVLTVGVLQAGTRPNVIPETARIEATVRSFSAVARERLSRETVRVVEGVAAAHGLEAEAVYRQQYPATVNDPGCEAAARESVGAVLGEGRHVELPRPVPGSEDFSRVLAEVPGAYLFLSACPAGADPQAVAANHSARAVFSDDVLPDGAALYAQLALDAIARGGV
ncbi:M20 metallopeptidase family protein [Zhihengliuella salsuginis]|uniref:Amidohydrolase n=1 Tax=Zhihengliuella salsuginis TaxID=578222 RepID=A0ABQ3GAZ5_9MICC|nr:M20 family metallopeptidase [Zhihengliuella salsuginis]GHD00120.1 amidohydrolase [Zhihengliuella salsuginis]